VKFKRLSALRLDYSGRLLACDGEGQHVKVISPAGEVVSRIDLPFGPEAIDVAVDGTIYCGGEGRLAKLDTNGTLIQLVEAPNTAESPITNVSRKRAKMCDVALRLRVAGIAASDKDVFVAFGSGWSLVATSKLFRFDRDLENAKLIAEGMRGCCQRCDIATRDDVVYVAENSVHRIVAYDREGKLLQKWGSRSRNDLEGFGACCNPMNLSFGPDGVLYTAESGLARVKRHTTDGEFLSLVGYVATDRFRSAGPYAASCSNIAIAVTRDGKRVYVMDYPHNQIRVLEKKG
jgi:sugar lactone lactonase YvrE